MDENLMFGISWPKNSGWQSSVKPEGDLQGSIEGGNVVFELAKASSSSSGGGFLPDMALILVVVTPKMFFTIEEVLDSFIRHQKRGVTVVSASIDQAHSGAILVTRDPKITDNSGQAIVRLLLGDAFTYYILMGDDLPQTQEYTKTRTEANLIFNSVRLLHR